jgi:hypothetical protein
VHHLYFHYFKSLSLNYTFFVKCSSSYVIKSTIHCNNEWYIYKLLTNYVLKRIWPKGVTADKYFELCDFSRENTNIDASYIHVYVWFKDDKHVIWMWIWSILKNISMVVRFVHTPTNFIFWLNRLIFSASINSHSDNMIYLHTLDVHLNNSNLINNAIIEG